MMCIDLPNVALARVVFEAVEGRGLNPDFFQDIDIVVVDNVVMFDGPCSGNFL